MTNIVTSNLEKFAESSDVSIVQSTGNFENAKKDSVHYTFFPTEFLFKYNVSDFTDAIKRNLKIKDDATTAQKERIKKLILYLSQMFVRQALNTPFNSLSGPQKLKIGSTLFFSNSGIVVTRLMGDGLVKIIEAYETSLEKIIRGIFSGEVPSFQQDLLDKAERFSSDYVRKIILSVITNPQSIFYFIKFTPEEVETLVDALYLRCLSVFVTILEILPMQTLQEELLLIIVNSQKEKEPTLAKDTVLPGYSSEVAEYFQKGLSCFDFFNPDNVRSFREMAQERHVNIGDDWDFYRNKNNAPKIYLYLVGINERRFNSVNSFIIEYVMAKSQIGGVVAKLEYVIKKLCEGIKEHYVGLTDDAFFQDDNKKSKFLNLYEGFRAELNEEKIGLTKKELEEIKDVASINTLQSNHRKIYEKIMRYLSLAIQRLAYDVEAGA